MELIDRIIVSVLFGLLAVTVFLATAKIHINGDFDGRPLPALVMEVLWATTMTVILFLVMYPEKQERAGLNLVFTIFANWVLVRFLLRRWILWLYPGTVFIASFGVHILMKGGTKRSLSGILRCVGDLT